MKIATFKKPHKLNLFCKTQGADVSHLILNYSTGKALNEKNNCFNHITVVNILLHSNIFVCMREFVCSFHCCHLPSRPICPLICESCLSCKIRQGFLFLWGRPRWTLFKCLFLRKSFCILENIKCISVVC